MTRRTVLLLIGLFWCWSAQALAQTVDTSATGTLIEQTSSVTQQVTAAAQQLEPITDQVSSTAGPTTPTRTGSGEADSDTASAPADDSSRGSDAADCEIAAGGRASGGGATTSAGAGAHNASVAARREGASQAGGEGVLGSVTEGTDPMPAPLPTAPNDFPFWGGSAWLSWPIRVFAVWVGALTTNLLRGGQAGKPKERDPF